MDEWMDDGWWHILVHGAILPKPEVSPYHDVLKWIVVFFAHGCGAVSANFLSFADFFLSTELVTGLPAKRFERSGGVERGVL
jgi:hypothetical protein